jgi:hypothetical protein
MEISPALSAAVAPKAWRHREWGRRRVYAQPVRRVASAEVRQAVDSPEVLRVADSMAVRRWVVACLQVGRRWVARRRRRRLRDHDQVDQEPAMKGTTIMISSKLRRITFAIVNCAILASLQDARAEWKQERFDTPQQAAQALIQVAANFDLAAAKEILGPAGTDIVSSEDPVADKNEAQTFAAKAKERLSIQIDKKDSNRAIFSVGNDDLPFPIPLLKEEGKWVFATNLGRDEILNRRVGANELNAIAICRGFVEAQHDYAAEKHDDSRVNQYAQNIISTPGKHDGLAWQNADGTWGGPVGPEVAKALQEGYSAKPDTAYHGYYFKVLKGQGPAAPMGQMDFVIGGAMIGGFALAAAPAEYRVTGVKTFIVGPDGKVYEKDFGKDTLKAFRTMDRYNPDNTWHETTDDLGTDNEAKGLSASPSA